MNDTPECDALEQATAGRSPSEAYERFRELARKLERERNALRTAAPLRGEPRPGETEG
jgi:hypothetical protein